MAIRPLAFLLTATIIFGVASDFATAQAWKSKTGFNALQSELGASLADGTGIAASMIEAPNGADAYRPDYNDAEFLNPDKNFIDCTNTNTGVSSHANNVATPFYGNSSSAAPGILDITLYEAEDWLNNVTGLANAGNPEAQPYGVQNHSYIGDDNPVGIITNLLRRSDYMASENNMVMVVGNANAGALPQFMVHGFNSITVGQTAGSHAAGTTQFYYSGRVKPEIVSPNGATSFSTPTVTGTAAILREAAAGTNADNAEVIRAMILAGATKREFRGWNQDSIRPLDSLFGTGELCVYNSYKIFLGDETDGLPMTPKNSTDGTGWDFGTIGPNQVLNYSIELTEPADHLSMALTWDITITDSNGSPTIFVPVDNLADLDLLIAGPTGVVQSMSTVYNNEHIYMDDLLPGKYTVVVLGDSSQTIDFGLAWRTATKSSYSPVEELNITAGSNVSGGLAEIADSDDEYLEIQVDQDQQIVAIELDASTGENWVNGLSLALESRVSSPNILRRIQFFKNTVNDYRSSTYTAHLLEGIRYGVGVSDSAAGAGYLMYTQTPVHSRFPTANARNAVHLIAVRNISGQWQYNNDTTWLDFVPDATDRLLASVDFSANTVTSLEGTTSVVSGISAGYLSGNLTFFADQWNGETNAGEFDVTGLYFTVLGDGAEITDTESLGKLYGEYTEFINQSSGAFKARVTWEVAGPILTYPWTVHIDRARFEVSR